MRIKVKEGMKSCVGGMEKENTYMAGGREGKKEVELERRSRKGCLRGKGG